MTALVMTTSLPVVEYVPLSAEVLRIDTVQTQAVVPVHVNDSPVGSSAAWY